MIIIAGSKIKLASRDASIAAAVRLIK